MVSSAHEALHRIFREDPGIFARSFDRLGIPFAKPVAVTLLPADLTEIHPVERRVDTLVQVDTVEGESYLLVVESQGRRDPRKHGSWAYYLTYLYAKYEMPPLLLVTSNDKATALWAAQPFDIGVPQWPSLTIRPLALGPHNTPVITDPDTAARDVPLAAFAALTHSDDPDVGTILESLAGALKTVDDETAAFFREFTEIGLGKTPAAEIWRHLMAIELSYFRSESSQRLRAEGLQEGKAEGLQEGKATSILSVLRARGIDVPQEVRTRITQCADLDTLDAWLTRAITVTHADDIFTGN